MSAQNSVTPRPETRETSSPEWLWTADGTCFGYRLGHSLFTFDGTEVGRFLGSEVYGVSGRYLGELKNSVEGTRLVRSVYKRSLRRERFIPTFGQAYGQPARRSVQADYSGFEAFPSVAEITKETFSA